MGEPGEFLKATLEGQPRELERLLADGSAATAAARLRSARRIFVVGTGTSYHGALVGQFMLRTAGVEAWAVRAFEFANYPPALRDGDALILLSHRGSKRFSRDSLTAFMASNPSWIAITGNGSALEGDGVVRTVEQEKSPVHTASHTGAMLRLAQIACELGKPTWRSQLASVPSAVDAAVAMREQVKAAVAGMNLETVVHFVGGGPARATSLEGALKLREAAHLVSAEGHDVEGVLHGPLVSIQPGQSVVVVAQPGPALERAREVAAALGKIGARVIAVGPSATSLEGAAAIVTTELDEVLAPIVNVIPLQWLAYEASRRMRVDADTFRKDEPGYAAAQKEFTL
ncbi:MAG: SIS domain-containing protein [Candidatus Dormibacterales bacterium]